MLQAPHTEGCLVARNNGFHWRLHLLHFPKSFFLMNQLRESTSMAATWFAQIIRELRDAGCCVIVATHELDEAERIADDVLVFHRGNVVASGTLHELRSGREEIRFRSHSLIDVHSLSTTLGYTVEQTRQSEFTVAGTSDSRVIVQLTDWAKANNVDIGDIGAGSQRLDDVFRRLTAEPTT
jgi:ABC-2 type transport system ATP-binding protein